MSNSKPPPREGSLDAPTRHPLDWRSAAFYDRATLNRELERVYDICHGCRRCVSLCEAFPTLFDLVDESETMEVDGVDAADYSKVADQCYLCDMCYMTKCPYVPPHEWAVDFPHLMLRSKAVDFKEKGASLRNRMLTSTDLVGRAATIPVVDVTVNALNANATFRKHLEGVAGVHREAPVPRYHSKTLRKRVGPMTGEINPVPVGQTTGKVALYATCYGNNNSPEVGVDIYKVFQHNGVQIELVPSERCCGMPKLELGDLESVDRARQANIPVLAALVDQGYDLIAPVPSCVLMYKQELPLMFPDDPDVLKVKHAFYDIFEYLWLRHKGGALNTEFKRGLGDVSYHVACHLRVQNVGIKARDILSMVPDTRVHAQERCSGHDGTYAVRVETHDNSVKIARPVVRKIDQLKPDHLASDCPMAGTQLATLAQSVSRSQHPVTLLRKAYGLPGPE